MNVVVNKAKRNATILVDLSDEDDRLMFISWMKQVQCRRIEDQFLVDGIIDAAGGEPEQGFPGYENMTQ